MAMDRVQLISADAVNLSSSSFNGGQGEQGKPPNVTVPKVLTVQNQLQKLKPPLVYILNHEEFIDKGYRKGSTKDVQNLKQTFNRLNCQVKVVKNPQKNDVTETIKKLKDTDFRNLSALVVIILSHGGENDIIMACDGNTYHLDSDVLYPICNNESLRGKPKILIVQACKGRLRADATLEEDGHYIKCYSTSEGFKAYRHQVEGSIYIQMLCKVMNQDARTKDFSAIIQDVNVKTEEESIRLEHRQVPSTEGRLNPFCFGHFLNNK
ncbi:hypothetical protein KR032_007670 [Drosophila birchii]|nr:hypothetical protein KR032_007670 [Drosophila birchii]